MKSLICFLAAGVLLVSPLVLEAKIVRTVEKTFAVQPGTSLKASTQGGDIVVQTADITEVRVTARQEIRASSESEADELLKNLSLMMEQQGDEIVVESKYEKSGIGFLRFNWPPVTVSYTVTVPTKFNLNLATSGGDIKVANLSGQVRARTSGGDMKFARIDGDLDARTSGGNITLQEGTAEAKLHTSGGDIVVERAGGPTKVSTSGGNITLNAVAQLIRATTSGGDIKAVLTSAFSEDSLLSTSGGNVRVQVPKTASFKLDAHTSGGKVDAVGLTLTLESSSTSKSRLVGTVNGGGPVLKLRTSGGDIRVRTE